MGHLAMFWLSAPCGNCWKEWVRGCFADRTLFVLHVAELLVKGCCRVLSMFPKTAFGCT